MLRLHQVHRPFDERLSNPWRQSDYYQLARNFDREGLDPRYPRIDWRGDGPGFAEMELPVLPWLGAVSHRLLGGPRVVWLRLWSAGFEILAWLLFVGLARRLLDPDATRGAVALFAVAPLPIELAGSLQPEPLVHALGLTAVLALARFHRGRRPRDLLWAAVALGLAIAAKLPAAHLGFLFAGVVLVVYGSRAVLRPVVWLAAWLALAPGAAWSLWARQFWLDYGYSLGVSNESHFLGLDLLWPPEFLVGLAKREVLVAITPLALPLLAVAGWCLLRSILRRDGVPPGGEPGEAGESADGDRPRGLIFIAGWWGAAWLFYLLTARTSADGWAYYYHLYSVAPVCLLSGIGFSTLRRWPWAWARPLASGLLVLALLGASWVAWGQVRKPSHDVYLATLHGCALELSESIPEEGRIVVRGGAMFDDGGRPVAHNESMVFAWIDRKGFCYGDEALSIDTLEELATRGGRYWLVGAVELERAAISDEVEARYRRLGTCTRSPYHLYDLAAPAPDRRPSITDSATPAGRSTTSVPEIR